MQGNKVIKENETIDIAYLSYRSFFTNGYTHKRRAGTYLCNSAVYILWSMKKSWIKK